MILLKVTTAKNSWLATIGFFNNGFEFQDYVCNGCHDLTILCLNMSVITIITVKNVDYRCIIYKISKPEVTKLLKSTALEKHGYI